jgi:hypothetical protein
MCDLVLDTYIDNPLRAPNTSSLLIGSGARTDMPAEQFAGRMDNIRIYSRALTDSEIQELYHERGGKTEQNVSSVADLKAKGLQENTIYLSEGARLSIAKKDYIFEGRHNLRYAIS